MIMTKRAQLGWPICLWVLAAMVAALPVASATTQTCTWECKTCTCDLNTGKCQCSNCTIRCTG